MQQVAIASKEKMLASQIPNADNQLSIFNDEDADKMEQDDHE